MVKSYDKLVERNLTLNWPFIHDHSCRILIIDGSGSGKTNVLLNLIKHQRPDIGKISLYVKDPFQASINYLPMGEKIKKSKSGHHYSQTIDNVYENLEDYNPTKKRKVLIVFEV